MYVFISKFRKKGLYFQIAYQDLPDDESETRIQFRGMGFIAFCENDFDLSKVTSDLQVNSAKMSFH